MKARLAKRLRVDDIRNAAALAPLFAAIIAPFSTLMDIPALTEPWYTKAGQPVADFTASVVLSAVGLAFNVFANGLLLFRFSSSEKWWRISTRLSVICWITKLIIAFVNVCYFGRRSVVGNDIQYSEGFWCAVVSLAVSFWVVFFLVSHWFIGMDRKTGEAKDPEKSKRISRDEVRIYGRHFMLQVTFFMFTIGLAALIFSRTENWTYFNGIYFIVVTALTIGFGDFYPTTTPGRIILFPFDILLISQLATIVSSIATFFNERTQKITRERQRLYEIQHHEEKDKLNPNPDLNDELEFLQNLYRAVQRKHQMHEILISTIVFLCFWLIGAVAFWQIEGWTYGNCLYFGYTFFFVIGYGDFAPTTDGGRVFFVVYALIAVPVMTSFAIQTVISTMSYFSKQMLTRRGKRMNSEPHPDTDKKADVHSAFPPHGQLVREAHQKVKEVLERRATESSGSGDEKREDELSVDISQVLALATRLEGHARRLLVGHLCSSGDSDIHLAGNLLKADWNVQRREILTVVGDQSDLNIDLDGDGKGDFEPGAQSDMQTGVQTGVETLEEVKKYRVVFAEFLAAAAALQRLEGKRQLIFERRRKDRGDTEKS